jgi:uncharacterized hydantoinase/oxoprolinase family protein
MLKRFWNWLLGKTTIDEKIEEKVNNAKKTIVAVKKEIADVKEAVADAIEDISEEVEDVAEAVKAGVLIQGKVTKSKLRRIKKQDLLDHAKVEFGQEFDKGMNKTNLINKVYELHHKK